MRLGSERGWGGRQGGEDGRRQGGKAERREGAIVQPPVCDGGRRSSLH
eukprot:COSAG02_NODE_1301_length_13367_cov_14.080570_12_plen_48_part_00